jgi:hypothetical protein
MPLVNVQLTPGPADLPRPVRALLREADRRIEQYQSGGRVPAFVPSDFAGAYRILRALAESHLTAGPRFCEWGSGFGVVTCMAAQLGFDACGIETDADLVAAARRLADDFDLPVEYVCDSFVPAGGEACLDGCGELSWMTTTAGSANAELGLDVDDFDLIYAYPWPDEELATAGLFHRFAADGAVLVTYLGGGEFNVRRKTARRPARR